jgi:hypothetical protein
MPRFIRSACLTDYVPIARSFGLDPYRLLREAHLVRIAQDQGAGNQ